MSYVGESLSEKVGRILAPAENALNLMANSNLSEAGDAGIRLRELPDFLRLLTSNTGFDATFIGYANGEFLLIRPLRTEDDHVRYAAPKAAALLVQSIERDEVGAGRGQYRFYSADGTLLRARAEPGYNFDPRTRPWFTAAHEAKRTILTDPYVYFTTRTLGVTMARPVRDGSGRLLHYEGVVEDITERKRARQELQESNQFRQEIIHGAGEGIVVYDRDLRYIVWNRYMEQMTGLTADRVLGRRPQEVLPFLREHAIDELLERALRGETASSADVPVSVRYVPSAPRPARSSVFRCQRRPNGALRKRFASAAAAASFRAKYVASLPMLSHWNGMATVSETSPSRRSPNTFTSWPVSGKAALNSAPLRCRSTSRTSASVGVRGA